VDKDAPTRSLPNVMNDYFGDLGLPVIHDLPFGHEPRMWTVPVGARVKLTIGEKPKIEIVEKVLA
jgi:muramoyltetrapeptide carboxypeptidase LdcA involved in peptidoglycan recycling